MTDAIGNKYISKPVAETAISGQTVVSSQPNSIYECTGEENYSTDTVKTNITSTTTEKEDVKTKRSAKELYAKLTGIAKQYGLSSEDVKNILQTVSGYTENVLLDLDEAEINKVINIINKAVEVLTYKNEKVDANSLTEMSKNIKIRVDNDWSLEGAVKDLKNNKRQESLADKLRRVWPKEFGPDFDFSAPENREHVKQRIQDYIRLYHKSEKLGNQDWAKMLANSKNDNERDAFDSILNEINPEYRAKFVKSWLYSYDKEENKIAAADRTDILEITQDTNEEQSREIAHHVRRHQSADGIKKSDGLIIEKATQYFEANDIEELTEKVENGEELTENEQKIYNQWQRFQGIIEGSVTGTVANENVSDEFKEEEIGTVVNPAIYSFGETNYKEIIVEIQKFIEEHKDEFNTPYEDITALLDRATDGNYLAIAENGKNAEITPPKNSNSAKVTENKSTENKTAKKVEKTTVKSVTIENKKAAPEKTTTTYTNSNTEEKEDISKKLETASIIEVKELHKDKSSNPLSFIIEVFNSKNKNKQVQEYVLEMFKRLSRSVQVNIFDKLNNNAKIAAAKVMTSKQLAKVEDSSNEFVRKVLEDIRREKEEKEKKGTCSAYGLVQ